MEEGTFVDKNIKSVDKVITILKYLNQGRILRLEHWDIKLAETNKGGFKLMWKTDSSEGTKWFGLDTTIETFSDLCNKFSDKEITIMQANMALQSFNKTDR